MRVKIRKGHPALNSRMLTKMIKEELSKTLQEQSEEFPAIDMDDPEIQGHLAAFRAAGIDAVPDKTPKGHSDAGGLQESAVT